MELEDAALGTWRYDSKMTVFRTVKSDLAGILQRRLAERAIPIRLGEGAGRSDDALDLDMAISEGEAVRASIKPGKSKFQVLLTTYLVPNEIGAGPRLESRAEYDEARRRRREAQLTAHQKAMELYEARRRDHELQLRKHEENVGRLRAEWDAGAGLRGAGLAARKGALRGMALVPLLGGLALSAVIYWIWPLGAYYEKVTTTWMGLVIIKWIALILPVLCLLLPACIGFQFAQQMNGRASRLSEPAFEEPPSPPRPMEPQLPGESPEGPFDVLDSKDRILGYCRHAVSEALQTVMRARPPSRVQT